MNLQIKDKYRTKIMEQLLHQNSSEQQHTDFNENFNNSTKVLEEMGMVKDQCQKIYQSMMFEKVKNQRALIVDDEQISSQREQNVKSRKECNTRKGEKIQDNNGERHKSINAKQNSIKKQSSNPLMKFVTKSMTNGLLNSIQPRGHLKSKQSQIVYHQKLPLMSISNNQSHQQTQILSKLQNMSLRKKNQSNPKGNDKQNNEINLMNSVQTKDNKKCQEVLKKKKYKFVSMEKLMQKAKRQIQEIQKNEEKNKMQSGERIEQKEVKYESEDSENKQEPEQKLKQNNEHTQKQLKTQRSKGSQEMMEFLESAREKLFENMKIQSNQEIPKEINRNESLDSKKIIQKQRQQRKKTSIIPLSHESYETKSFTIQIQVSANKTCEVQLTLESDPLLIAREFIESNRQELRNFKAEQLNKLEELLSKKIFSEIERQKEKVQKLQKKQMREKYRKIVEHSGVNQVLLADDQDMDYRQFRINKDKKTERKETDSNRKDKQLNINKKKKQQQCSHVIIEKIDIPTLNEELQTLSHIQQHSLQQSHQNNLHELNQLNNQPQSQLNLQKQVSFNPHTNVRQFKNFIQQNSPIQQAQKNICLKGYINSPHQLITYRQEDEMNSEVRQIELESDPIGNNKEQIILDHIPLTNWKQPQGSSQPNDQIAQQMVLRNRMQQPYQRNKSRFNNNDEQIGANKILSKSRQKLNKLKKSNEQPIKSHIRQSDSNTESHQGNQNQQSLEQYHNQQKQKFKSQDLHSESNPITPFLSAPLTQSVTCYPVINTFSQQIVSRLGKQNIISSLKQKELNRKQRLIKEKELKEEEELKECSFRPKINELSKSIDSKNNIKRKKMIKIGDLVGDSEDNFMKGNDAKVQHSPRWKHKEQGTESNCFKTKQPMFFRQNPIEESFQRNNKTLDYVSQPRYQQLYDNFKQIQSRKQEIRQKSLEQIPFKPEINPISKKIIQTKRNSLNSSTCNEFYVNSHAVMNLSRGHTQCKKQPNQKRMSLHESTVLANESCYQMRNQQSLGKKRKSLNFSRNLQGLQIGQYLYKEAMRMKKKKQALAMNAGKIDNFKPLDKSEKILNRLKEKRLAELFYEIIQIQKSNLHELENFEELQPIIQPEVLDLESQQFLSLPLKLLLPLLEEIKQLSIPLTKSQFIESGLKLFSYLSPDEKSILLNTKSKEQEIELKQIVDIDNGIKNRTNETSQQLRQRKRQSKQDIYRRGLAYRRNTKEKVELSKEDKVRKELQMCTFKPVINKKYESQQ